MKEGISMSNEEIELVKILRESENPGEAAFIAINVFVAFLKQYEEAPTLPVDVPLESA